MATDAEQEVVALRELVTRGLVSDAEYQRRLRRLGDPKRPFDPERDGVASSLARIADLFERGLISRESFDVRKRTFLYPDEESFSEGRASDRFKLQQAQVNRPLAATLGKAYDLFLSNTHLVRKPEQFTDVYIAETTSDEVVASVEHLDSSELAAVQETIKGALRSMTADEFVLRYAGVTAKGGLGPELPLTHACDHCQRRVPKMERLSFNVSRSRHDGWQVLCPACGDAWSRDRSARSVPNAYVVRVPNEPYLDDCVAAYVEHGWEVAERAATRAALRRAGSVVDIRVWP